MNPNRFCLFLLILTLVFIIVGIFFVASSLHYSSTTDDSIELLSRRSLDRKPSHSEPVPVFPEDYHASGLLILPHSSIAEPFEIWFSNTLGASRIDYYYGTDKTFQRGDEAPYGKYYKVVPMYNDKQGNFEGCWTVTGRKNWPINAQTIIPNMTWFKYVKTEVYTGTLSTKWHYEYWAYGMLNSQNVWVTKSKPYRPIRYEMKGYDSMLGSYYDHYVLEYVSFEQWRPQIQRFELPRDVPCFNWSLTLESSLISNPMQEFASFTAEHLVDTGDLFTVFKKNHKKNYDDKKEHRKRKHIYKHNSRYIHSMNRKSKQFQLKSNHFTDMSDEEFETHVGSITKSDPRNHTGMKPLHKHEPVYLNEAPKPIDIPEELDWRDYGAVSPVKGQGICGSCYTFSAAGAAEGAHFLKTGSLVELSSQQILDCSWGSGNHGCKGGHYAAALSFLYLHGAATLDSYGKYLAQEGVCHFNDTALGAKIDAFAYVPSYNNTALKHAIAKFGPAAVSINVSPLSFKFYSNGVYHDEDCWSNRTRHSALVIGYGKIKNGREYWLVKNSWSDSWGERGYIRVAMDENMCGVTEAPVVALVNHITFQFPVKEKILSVDFEDEATLGRKVKAKRKGKAKAKPGKKSELKITTKDTKDVTRNGVRVTKDKGKEIEIEQKKGGKKDIGEGTDMEEGKDNFSKQKTRDKSKDDKDGEGGSKSHKLDSEVERGNAGKKDISEGIEMKDGKDNFAKQTKTEDKSEDKKESENGSKDHKIDGVTEVVKGKEAAPKDVDDREVPKIEPHDQKHDIGALGELVASDSHDSTKEDTSKGTHERKEEEILPNEKHIKIEEKKPEGLSFQVTAKEKTDDFKLPVFHGNVDQSKLPNAAKESSSHIGKGTAKSVPKASLDESDTKSSNKDTNVGEESQVKQSFDGEKGLDEGETAALGEVKDNPVYHASDKDVDVTVQGLKETNNIEVSVAKTVQKDKSKLKKKKKLKSKKTSGSATKTFLAGKKRSRGEKSIGGVKMHKALQDALNRMYSKIGKGLFDNGK